MNKDACLWILSDLQVLARHVLVRHIDERGCGRGTEGRMGTISTGGVLTIWGNEQVSDVLHVDLKETDGYTEYGLVRILFNVVEDVLDGARNYSKLVLSPRHLLIIQIVFRGCHRCLLLLSIEVSL